MKRLVLALAALGLLGGCGILGGRDRPTTPTVGQRVPVLGTESQVEVDPLLADMPVTVPGPVANPRLGAAGRQCRPSRWSMSRSATPRRGRGASRIGAGNSFRTRLVSEPVVADGRVYTIDTLARVRAFNAETGAQLWEHQVRGENSPTEALFGGGVTFDGGRVYATNGAGDAAALDAATGNQIWMVKPGGPLRGAPTVADDTVYVLSPGQPALRAQRAERRDPLDRLRLVRAGRRVRQRRARPSPRPRSSPAIPRASSPPIATRTARWSGRTRSRAPASRPWSARFPTSTPIR